MIWPIGQPHGEMHAMAVQSREIWADVLHAARLPHFPTGSLHVVHRDDEAAVLREFAELAPSFGYECQWLNSREVSDHSQAAQSEQLLGGLWSAQEITVDPQVTTAAFLSERFDVEFGFATAVRSIELPLIKAGAE